jgi:hypothetical protein
MLAASSDHGTIHIFAVENPLVEQMKIKKQSTNLAGFFSGKKEQSSFAQFRVNEERTKVGFSEDSTVLFVISQSGKYFEAQIPDSEGDCRQIGVFDML